MSIERCFECGINYDLDFGGGYVFDGISNYPYCDNCIGLAEEQEEEKREVLNDNI